MCGYAVGVNIEVLDPPKCFPAVACNFQMLPFPASRTEQINAVLIACKLTVVYVTILGKHATNIELHTLVLSPQIDDSDSTSEYSDDDVVGRGRSEPETKPILSVREYDKCLWHMDFITVPLLTTKRGLSRL